MRRGAGAALLAVLFSGGTASPARAVDLIVHVTDLHNGAGQVIAAVFDSEETWLDDGHETRSAALPASPGGVTFDFKAMAPGVYAVVVLHDENGNGKMDFTWFGFPEEGYAFSRGARPFLSAPSFRATAFRIGPLGGEITIHMVY
jgi:uncharacterized protein (DUF2141 family)